MTIDQIMAGMTAVIDGADGRSLTADEVEQYEALEADLSAAQADASVRQRQQAYETPVPAPVAAQAVPAADADRHPLAPTAAALDELQHAIRHQRAARVDHNITNATVTTGELGSRRVWGSNVLDGPRILHRVMGVPTQRSDALFAAFPQLELPSPSASVGEGSSLAEYDSSTAGSLTLGRFGRFTDLSEESLLGADAAAIVGQHNLAIALDLDEVLITIVEDAAGTPVTFDDPEADVKSAIAEVVANTAQDDLGGLVILTHPDDANLLQDIDPVSGSGIGEPFMAFAGVRVYPSNSVESGLMTVAALRAGIRYFEAMAARTVTDTDVKTSVTTVATANISGYAQGLADGFSIQIDVVA